jgi:hypothetical protein
VANIDKCCLMCLGCAPDCPPEEIYGNVMFVPYSAATELV